MAGDFLGAWGCSYFISLEKYWLQYNPVAVGAYHDFRKSVFVGGNRWGGKLSEVSLYYNTSDVAFCIFCAVVFNDQCF